MGRKEEVRERERKGGYEEREGEKEMNKQRGR